MYANLSRLRRRNALSVLCWFGNGCIHKWAWRGKTGGRIVDPGVGLCCSQLSSPFNIRYRIK
jgi:hypothetical protein